MASIKLKHSGGNGVIIAAPTSNPSSDKTLTLPSTETGTIVSKDSANSLQNITGINGGQLGNRNLIINGAMQVAQRGTSSTSNGYGSVDRFLLVSSGTDEALTQAQVDVASGTTPYTLGFRKAFKATNGNQISGAGTADLVRFNYAIEAQDIAQSGWNYTSSSSYITLSFWIKSSVAQNFFFRLQSQDGTSQGYVMETGSLSADTWTKIIKTIPGNSNIQIDNNNEQGMKFEFVPFRGTNTTGTRPLNAWAAFDSATITPDSTSTWYTTNDATLEWTGFQLEVGSVATDFEHRSFGQELALCQRYFAKFVSLSTGYGSANGYARSTHLFPCQMRSAPSRTITSIDAGSLNSSRGFVDSVEVTWQGLSGTSTGEFTIELNSEL